MLDRRITLMQGDITELEVIDMIVNAANARMVPGGGVDGAINRAAGPKLKEAMGRIGKVPAGTVTVTGGYRLNARWVAHAVGPIYDEYLRGEAEPVLAMCYSGAMGHAKRLNVRHIAFPLISSGVYGYPLPEACRVALSTINQHLYPKLQQVRVVAFDKPTLKVLQGEADALAG